MSETVEEENPNYVQCLICKRYFQYLNTIHLKTHGYTTLDYMEEFPGAPLQSRVMVEEHMNQMEDYVIPQFLIDQRAEGLREWWRSPAGLAKRKNMSEHPIAGRR